MREKNLLLCKWLWMPVSQFLNPTTGETDKTALAKWFMGIPGSEGDSQHKFGSGLWIDSGNYSPGHLLQALTAEGKSVERGVIIVRKDSGITDVKALKGKKILFGDEQSLTKHITIKKLLAENGLDVKKDLAGYSFGRDCEGIILRVYLRKTDAGAIDNWSWKALHEPGEQEVEADQLTEIAEGAAVPYWVFSVHKDTDESIAAKFEQALLKLDNKNAAYKEILKNMEIGGFVKSKETDYGILQDLR